VAGNGHTSRVWKGDESGQKADISNTGIGYFIDIHKKLGKGTLSANEDFFGNHS